MKHNANTIATSFSRPIGQHRQADEIDRKCRRRKRIRPPTLTPFTKQDTIYEINPSAARPPEPRRRLRLASAMATAGTSREYHHTGDH